LAAKTTSLMMTSKGLLNPNVNRELVNKIHIVNGKKRTLKFKRSPITTSTGGAGHVFAGYSTNVNSDPRNENDIMADVRRTSTNPDAPEGINKKKFDLDQHLLLGQKHKTETSGQLKPEEETSDWDKDSN